MYKDLVQSATCLSSLYEQNTAVGSRVITAWSGAKGCIGEEWAYIRADKWYTSELYNPFQRHLRRQFEQSLEW